MRPAKASTSLVVGGMALGLLVAFAAGAAHAQDPVKVAPKNFKVLLENESVRVLDFRSTGGQKIPMHSHPAYVSYSISGSGKTKFTSPDGKTTEQPNNAAGATWHDAETHASEYMGAGATHVLLVELKGK
jgi:quercetin dioxygenase-like cupin family protein